MAGDWSVTGAASGGGGGGGGGGVFASAADGAGEVGAVTPVESVCVRGCAGVSWGGFSAAQHEASSRQAMQRSGDIFLMGVIVTDSPPILPKSERMQNFYPPKRYPLPSANTFAKAGLLE